MTTTELFRMVIATYGYPSIGPQIYGVFRDKEEAMRVKAIAPGIIIKNETGLGWPRAWRIVSAEPDDHGDGRGAIIASCEAVESEE